MQKRIGIAIAVTLLASPLPVLGQGAIPGAERGARGGGAVGNDVGGAVGGAVGGIVGGVTGAVGGILGVEAVPRFREYVVREGRSAYHVTEEIRPGMILPREDVVFYQVPPEFGVPPSYRYTVVNDQIILVEPRTRKVVQIID